MARVIYDATNETFISDGAGCLPSSGKARSTASPVGRVPSSGITPDARAAGDLRFPPVSWSKHTQVMRERRDLLAKCPPSIPSHKAAGTLRAEIIDGLTTIAGLMVFATVALFFFVLA